MMRAGLLIFLASLVSGTAAFAEPAAAPTTSATDFSSKAAKRIAKIMAERDGASCATGYKVRSVRDEYQIAAALGVDVVRQSLMSGKKPCDLLTGVDLKTGKEREVWFDISAIYPAF